MKDRATKSEVTPQAMPAQRKKLTHFGYLETLIHPDILMFMECIKDETWNGEDKWLELFNVWLKVKKEHDFKNSILPRVSIESIEVTENIPVASTNRQNVSSSLESDESKLTAPTSTSELSKGINPPLKNITNNLIEIFKTLDIPVQSCNNRTPILNED